MSDSRGATFTTDGRTVSFTGDEYEQIANTLRALGPQYIGAACIALNLADSARAISDSEPYAVVTHPYTAELFALAHSG
jgi:methionine synthase I (cobalamin-dependent)